jgi:hypothetical protein
VSSCRKPAASSRQQATATQFVVVSDKGPLTPRGAHTSLLAGDVEASQALQRWRRRRRISCKHLTGKKRCPVLFDCAGKPWKSPGNTATRQPRSGDGSTKTSRECFTFHRGEHVVVSDGRS